MWYWQWECADAAVEVWDFPASAACPEPQQWRQRRWRFNDREVSLVGFLWWKITGSLSAPPLSLWMRVYTGSEASMWRSLRKREAARRLDTTWYLQLIFNYTFKSVCLTFSWMKSFKVLLRLAVLCTFSSVQADTAYQRRVFLCSNQLMISSSVIYSLHLLLSLTVFLRACRSKPPPSFPVAPWAISGNIFNLWNQSRVIDRDVWHKGESSLVWSLKKKKKKFKNGPACVTLFFVLFCFLVFLWSDARKRKKKAGTKREKRNNRPPEQKRCEKTRFYLNNPKEAV